MQDIRRDAWVVLVIEVAVIVGLIILFGKAVWGQAMLPDHWELGIFQGANLTTPVSVTVYPALLVRCALPHAFSADTAIFASNVDGPSDNIPNPTLLAFSDPTNAQQECRADVSAPVLALALGTGYRGMMRAVDSTGVKSAWSTPSNTFRRAPRGQPCTMPSGASGVQLNVIADINGRLTSVSMCVQQ